MLGSLSPAAPPRPHQDLGTPNADDSVDIAGGIVEVGDSECMLASRNPVPFGGRVDLEHVRPCAEDGLLPAWGVDAQWELGNLTQPPRRLKAKLVEAWAHLAVDIGQAGLSGLRGAARGVAGAAALASEGRGGLSVSPPAQDRLREANQVQPQDPPPGAPFIELQLKM